MNVTRLIWISVFLCFFTSVSSAGVHTYYVSTDGSDEASGTRIKPWKSIQHAVNHLEAGDTLNINQGDYFETADLKSSGRENALITIRGVGHVTFDLSASYSLDQEADSQVKKPVFETKGHHHIRFENLRFRGGWAALEIAQSHHIEVEGFETVGTAYAIRMRDASFINVKRVHAVKGLKGFRGWGDTHHIQMEDIEAMNFVDTGANYDPDSPNGDGFIFENKTHHLEFRNIVSAYNGDAGLDIKGNHVVMENVIVFGNKNGLKLWGEDIQVMRSKIFDQKSVITSSGSIQDGVGIHVRRGDAHIIDSYISGNEKQNLKVIKNAKLTLESCVLGRAGKRDHVKGQLTVI